MSGVKPASCLSDSTWLTLAPRASSASSSASTPSRAAKEMGDHVPACCPLRRISRTLAPLRATPISAALEAQSAYLASARGALTLNGVPVDAASDDSLVHDAVRAIDCH